MDGFSTFFPKHWAPQKVIDSINEAFANNSVIDKDGEDVLTEVNNIIK